MEDLINQKRAKVSGGGQGKAAGSSIPRERRIPIHKTQSSKGDAEKRSQSWFGRRFSRQMSRRSGSPAPVDELASAAVAAATFAVNSLEDSKGKIGKKSTGLSPQDSSLSRAKSKKDKAPQTPEPGPSSSSRPSGKVLTTKNQGSPETGATSPNLQRRPTLRDQLLDKSDSTSSKIPIPPPPPPPRSSQSIKKPTIPAFPASSGTMRAETSLSKPDSKPSTPSSQPQQKPTSGSALRGGTRADVWEAMEMERIKERYEKMNAIISSWEEGKKKKAKAKLDSTESELARRRAKAMEKFREEMESINRVADGARAQAEEMLRNYELKAKEKADKYRRTGKFPRTRFCF